MLAIVLATFLATLIVPLVRLLAIKSFRNRIGNPLFTLVIPFFLFVSYLAFLGVLALYAPTLLYLLALVVSLFLLYLAWHARPSAGRSRGLPPGSLVLFPLGQWNDVRFYEKGFERCGPIFKTSDIYRPAVCIVGIERIREFLETHQDAIQTPKFNFGKFIPGGFLRFTDPARHAETRPLFREALTPSVYLAQQREIERLVGRELAAFSRATLGAPDGIPPKLFLARLLRETLTPLFFGIDLSAPEFSRMRELLDATTLPRLRSSSTRNFNAILDEMLPIIRTAAAENLTPCFASELERLLPGALSDRYFALNLIFMFQVGRSDLGGLLLWIMKMLADNPNWLDQLRRAYATSDLSTRIVLETLRLEQSEFLIRETTREIVFQDYTIPRGWFVRLCVRESHHLSDLFEDSARFNPNRFLLHRFTRSEYMPFGAFNKTCLGEFLTLRLAGVFATMLANEYALHIASDGPPEFSGFHSQPSSRFKVQLPPYAIPTLEPPAENKIPVLSV